jgi:hypothetical protein
MEESKFTVETAESLLHKNKIHIKGKVIEVTNGCGLKCLAAIDYLVNNHSYVSRFKKKD